MEESDSDSDSEKAWSYDATQVTKLYMFRAKQVFVRSLGGRPRKSNKWNLRVRNLKLSRSSAQLQ